MNNSVCNHIDMIRITSLQHPCIIYNTYVQMYIFVRIQDISESPLLGEIFIMRLLTINPVKWWISST